MCAAFEIIYDMQLALIREEPHRKASERDSHYAWQQTLLTIEYWLLPRR